MNLMAKKDMATVADQIVQNAVSLFFEIFVIEDETGFVDLLTLVSAFMKTFLPFVAVNSANSKKFCQWFLEPLTSGLSKFASTEFGNRKVFKIKV